jgi:MFS family permease
MINQHNLNFDQDQLKNTFVKSTFLNGISAIISGLIANLLVSTFGLVGPFIFAAILSLVCCLLIGLYWTENYGLTTTAFVDKHVLLKVFAEKQVLLLTVMHFTFESSMYIFVFLWSPILEEIGILLFIGNINYGLVFSTLMVSLMIGSIVFKRFEEAGLDKILFFVFVVSSLSFIIPCFIKVT